MKWCILTICSVLLLAGCGKQEAKEFDDLSIQLLTEAFDAVHQQKHELAATRLEKLPESQFMHQMILRERQNQAIVDVCAKVEEGKLEDGLQILSKRSVKIGLTPGIRQAQEELNGLIATRDYLKKLPFSDSHTATAEIEKLPKPELFPESISYANWLKQQYAMRDELRRIEMERTRHELLREIDIALVGGDPNLPRMLSELHAVDPRNPLSNYLVTQKPTGNINPYTRELIWLLGYHFDQTVPIKELSALSPRTFSGRYLKAVAVARSRNVLLAFTQLRTLAEDVGRLQIQVGETALHSRMKRADQSAAPNISGILNPIYQLQAD